MMESFYAHKRVTFQASLTKIEASKLLLFYIWRRASAHSPSSIVQKTDVLRVLPNDWKGRLFEQQVQQQSTIPTQAYLKKRHYHKVTENWRLLLTIAMESMTATGLFARKTMSLKPPSKDALEHLAKLSTVLTIRLLSQAQKLAEQKKHHAIQKVDIQGAYRLLRKVLFPGKWSAQKGRHLVETTIEYSTQTKKLVRGLSEQVIRNKIRSLRTWNRSAWGKQVNDETLRRLLQQIAPYPLVKRDVQFVIQQFSRLIRPISWGTPMDSQLSSISGVFTTIHFPARLLRGRSTGTKPRLLSLDYTAQLIGNIFPVKTLVNGDVEVHYKLAHESKKRVLLGPMLDSMRDTTLHWMILQQRWKDRSDTVPLSPFAAELLSERMSEWLLFVLREAQAGPRYEKPSNQDGSSLQDFWGSLAGYIFVHPPDRHPSWRSNKKLLNTKKALVKQYKQPLFQDVTRAAGLSTKRCTIQKGQEFNQKWNEVLGSKKKGFSKDTSRSKEMGIQHHMGAGIAVGDFDRDGKVDLFFAGDGCNRLYRNLGDYRFQDVTKKLGIQDPHPDSRQALFVDVNNDNRLDLFVLHSHSPSRLWLQRPDGRFHDVSKTAGFGLLWGAHTATFLDSDNDGLLDVYVGTYGAKKKGDKQYPSIDGNNGRENVLFRNLGNGRFTNITQKAGVSSTRWTLATLALDLNQDGYLDLWLANDFGRDQVFLNQKNGSFREVSRKLGVDDRGNGMNVSAIDWNRDGNWDVYISVIDMFSKQIRFILPTPKKLVKLDDRILKTSFYLSGNKLFQNQPGKPFRSVENKNMEPGARGWSWAGLFLDVDNDGDLDFYLANGWIPESAMGNQSNQFFVQHNRRWFLLPGQSPARYKSNSRSAVAIDLSGTGRLDLVLNDYLKGPKILKNMTSYTNNWFKVRLHGRKNNKQGVGASVRVFAGKQAPQMRLVSCGSHYLSQADTTVHFGLGSEKIVKRVEILWPGGKKQVIRGPFAAKQILTAQEPR